MQRTLGGDEHELYREHHRRLVLLLCRSLNVSASDAEEAAQFAWLKLLEGQPRRSAVFGWLYTVAKHELYARYRRARREQVVDRIPEAAHEPDFAHEVDRTEVNRVLGTAIRDVLTDNQRVALALWAQGYPYKEIAARLGKTYTWTNRHISEGLRALRHAIGREPSR